MPRRRIKVNQEQKDKATISVERLNKIGEEISKRQAAVKKAGDEIAQLEIEAKNLMEFLGFDELNVPGKGTHTLKPTVGRSSRKVRVRDYADLVSEDVFYASASVTLKEAGKHLSDKELDSVVTTTMGVDGPAAYKWESK